MDEFIVAEGRVIGVRDVSCLQCGMLLLSAIDADAMRRAGNRCELNAH